MSDDLWGVEVQTSDGRWCILLGTDGEPLAYPVRNLALYRSINVREPTGIFHWRSTRAEELLDQLREDLEDGK